MGLPILGQPTPGREEIGQLFKLSCMRLREDHPRTYGPTVRNMPKPTARSASASAEFRKT